MKKNIMNSSHAMQVNEYQYVSMECKQESLDNDGLTNKGGPLSSLSRHFKLLIRMELNSLPQIIEFI